ncbi:MAG: hypothetical protein IJ297_03655 [Clostridia bacterium]|nr:hypothetical protein [Clostridia bacterium]
MNKKKLIMYGVIVLLCTIVFIKFSDNDRKTAKTPPENFAQEQQTENKEYPINDLWVYRYNSQTGKSEFAPCGYVDEYTSIVAEPHKELTDVITGSYMYLGTIKGYQNSDKTMEVFQVRLPEISENFVLTNDNVKLDYSGNKKMIEVTGWIYMRGTTIIAVSPLYEE